MEQKLAELERNLESIRVAEPRVHTVGTAEAPPQSPPAVDEGPLVRAVKDLTEKVQELSSGAHHGETVSQGSVPDRPTAMPLPGHNVPAGLALGPPHAGLTPLVSRESAFDAVLYSRAYRLLNIRPDIRPVETGQIGKHANRLRQLLPPGTEFQPRDPVGILSFLSEVKVACDSLGIHEGTATTMLHFLLAKEAQKHVDSLRRVGLGGKRTLV